MIQVKKDDNETIQPQINLRLQQLKYSILSLKKNIINLEEKLGPISHEIPVSLESEYDENTNNNDLVPLAAALLIMENHIRHTNNRVKNLIENLEIQPIDFDKM